MTSRPDITSQPACPPGRIWPVTVIHNSLLAPLAVRIGITPLHTPDRRRAGPTSSKCAVEGRLRRTGPGWSYRDRLGLRLSARGGSWAASLMYTVFPAGSVTTTRSLVSSCTNASNQGTTDFIHPCPCPAAVDTVRPGWTGLHTERLAGAGPDGRGEVPDQGIRPQDRLRLRSTRNEATALPLRVGPLTKATVPGRAESTLEYLLLISPTKTERVDDHLWPGPNLPTYHKSPE